MKTTKIEIPEGFEIANFDKQTGVVNFQKVPVTLIPRVNTFELVCKEMGENPDDYQVTANHPRLRGLQVLARLLLIIECFQQGADLDVYNTNQKKWFPWNDVSNGPSGFRFDGSYCPNTIANSVLGPLLGFQDEATCDYVSRTFLPEYKSFVELTHKK